VASTGDTSAESVLSPSGSTPERDTSTEAETAPDVVVVTPSDDGTPEAEATPVTNPNPTESDADAVAVAADAVEQRLKAIDLRVAGVEESIAGIARSVAEIARLGQRHADHVDELHSDNQRLRSGEIALAVAPIHRDIIRLHDELQSLEDTSDETGSSDLALVRARVTDVLGRWGIIRHVPDVGDAFDSKVHQGVGRVESNDGADGTVAQVRRAGFAYEDGRTIRVAEVEVFRAIGPPATETAPMAPEVTDVTDDTDDTVTVTVTDDTDDTDDTDTASGEVDLAGAQSLEGRPPQTTQPDPTTADQQSDNATSAREP
jgi:molecular chaperone GrpE (heat shock protein)